MNARVVLSLVLVAMLYCTVQSDSSIDTPFVVTHHGKIFGRHIEVHPWQLPRDTIAVEAYTMIPYAEPPVGELRYKHPVKKVQNGDLNATTPNVFCPQITLGIKVDMEESEDCLFLDVFVPSPRPESAAVMVWIHGGGFVAGAGSIPEQLPIPLASYGQVIVVTFNYRLGILGFLATGDDEIPANLGMFDQREALLWVQDNIAAFGGDPSRVTIFGESAGAASVHLHLVSPLSAGLFSGAILQSGAAIMKGLQNEMVPRTFELAKEVGCDFTSSKETATCLRNTPWEKLNLAYSDMFPGLTRPVAPIVDGHFLPDDVMKLHLEQPLNCDNILHGLLANEGAIFLFIAEVASNDDAPPPVITEDDFRSLVVDLIKITDPLVLDTTVWMYSDTSQITRQQTDYFKSVVDIFNDIFICPANLLSMTLSIAGKNVYSYEMTHVPSHSVLGPLKWAGATHLEDIPYVFGSALLRNREDGPKGMSGFFDGGEEAELSKQIMRYWTNFAKTGNPNLSSLDPETVNNPLNIADWERFTPSQPFYKQLDHGFPTGQGIPRAKECHFWSKIFPKLMGNSLEMAKLRAMLADHVAEHSFESCSGDSCP